MTNSFDSSSSSDCLLVNAHSLIYSFTHCLVRSFNHSLVCSFVLRIPSFTIYHAFLSKQIQENVPRKSRKTERFVATTEAETEAVFPPTLHAEFYSGSHFFPQQNWPIGSSFIILLQSVPVTGIVLSSLF